MGGSTGVMKFMMITDKRARRRLTIGLCLAFALSILAIGPGIYLVNPNPGDPNSRFLFLGMPIIYAWAVFWYLVQAAVILIAYFFLWNAGTEPARRG